MMCSNEAFIYLERVIEQTESKAITVLEPPLGAGGKQHGMRYIQGMCTKISPPKGG